VPQRTDHDLADLLGVTLPEMEQPVGFSRQTEGLYQGSRSGGWALCEQESPFGRFGSEVVA
jgi:hypothetical protein